MATFPYDLDETPKSNPGCPLWVNEPDVEPGSAQDEPTRNTRCRIEEFVRLPEEDLLEPWEETMRLQDEDVDQDVGARRRLAEGDSNPVAAEHSFSGLSFLLMPQRMPRGAFFEKVVMPWIVGPRDIGSSLC